jgi:TRAP-type C4-dicarboxylate transport system substrate-binding protein|tara:strand:+ start:51 stop:1091 length:1041 start_codon:yes stop_codon:yes gene_type:complete
MNLFNIKIALSIAALAFASSSVHAQSIDKDYKFKMSNVLGPTHHISLGVDKFAEIVDKKSEGKIKIRTYHGGQLGSGKETFEAVQAGFMDMATDSYANLYTLTPAFEAFHLPYIFESRSQQIATFQSDKVIKRVDEQLNQVGLKWLMTAEFSPRQIATSNKAIKSPADLKGMKLRASRSPLEIDTQGAWGASGVTIDWPSVPEALRTGLVDGETVGYDSIYSAKHYVDSIQYFTELNFQSYGLAVVFNHKKWVALPDSVKAVLQESAREAEAWHVKFLSKYVNDAKAKMIASGNNVFVPSEKVKNEFKKMAKESVWAKHVGKGVDKAMVDLINSEKGPVEKGEWFK